MQLAGWLMEQTAVVFGLRYVTETRQKLHNHRASLPHENAENRLQPRRYHAQSGNTLADYQYQFNAVSSITQMIDGAGTHNYTYDTRDRLTAATHPNQTNESYTLDDVGNRTASHQGSSYSYQSFNRLVAANSNTYAYNSNGNLTSKTDASGSWGYTWDYESRLKQAVKSGGVTVSYSYDALGRRIQRSSSTSGTTKFVFDGTDVVRDLNTDGSTAADYLNGPGVDDKLRQTVGGTTSYFVTDHLSTTRALTDASGNLTSTLSYDSFGNVTSGSASTRYTYTGRELDADTGLMYYRARWYDAEQGRFVSEDPIGLAGGINLFAYVENNPLLFSDPSGLCPQKPSQGDPNNKCDSRVYGAEMKREMTGLAKKVGGRFDNRSGTIKGLEKVQSQYVVKRFKSSGFSQFRSFNSAVHPGVNLERQVDNDTVWYHVTVEPGKQGAGATATHSRITIHCDNAENYSLHHIVQDYLQWPWPF